MQLPPPSLSFMRFVRFASYVAARLKRAKEHAWAAEAGKAADDVKAVGRAVEDRGLEVIPALADRDGIDDDLDDLADGVRRALASTSNTAHPEAPYTQILPNGIAWVTEAPLDEEEARYGDFAARLDDYLEPADPTRAVAGPVRENLTL